MYILAANAEDGGKLTVKAGFCGMFEIVVHVGNTAAGAAEELAARANVDYFDKSFRIALAYGFAVSILAVLFNGNRNLEPTESSIIAAKLCLEGFSLDPNILFFFNSNIAAGSWITANREYTMTVGRHDFYS